MSPWPALAAMLVGAGGAYAVLNSSSCGRGSDPPQPVPVASTAAPTSGSGTVAATTAEAPAPAPSNAGNGLIDPTDGGSNNLLAIPAGAVMDDKDDAGVPTTPPAGPMLGAAHFMTNVFERPDYSSPRIGYLRAGAKIPIRDGVLGEPVKRIRSPSCKDGWVAIVPRGYICLEKGGGALNLEQPNVRLATAPPNWNELLPYKYAFVWRNGAPLYRKVPTKEQWLDKEPWLKPAPKKPKKVDPEKDDKADSDDSPPADKPTSDIPDLLDAGTAAAETGAWWERDAGKGSISLRDTMESEGLVARRMAKGFAISIDRTFVWSGRTWHRTTMGLVAPADAVAITKGPEFQGAELTGDVKLPVGWAVRGDSAVFESKDKRTFTPKEKIKRQSFVRLLAEGAPGYEEIKVGAVSYVPTVDGRWVRAGDLVRVDPAVRPTDVKPVEKWIDVSIKGQTLVAYEGDKPVYVTLVSTGRDGTNLKGKFATVQGSYRVREKHVAATMDGDTSGELYSIDDVPYIQYFHQAYALHGAFWHGDFGRVRSHGCVNLSPTDAKRLFLWTEPKVPEGWHAVWSSDSNPGTKIVTRP